MKTINLLPILLLISFLLPLTSAIDITGCQIITDSGEYFIVNDFDVDTDSCLDIRNVSVTIDGNGSVINATGFNNIILFTSTAENPDAININLKNIHIKNASNGGIAVDALIRNFTLENIFIENTQGSEVILIGDSGTEDCVGVTLNNVTTSDFIYSNSVGIYLSHCTNVTANNINVFYIDSQALVLEDIATSTLSNVNLINTQSTFLNSYGVFITDGNELVLNNLRVENSAVFFIFDLFATGGNNVTFNSPYFSSKVNPSNNITYSVIAHTNVTFSNMTFDLQDVRIFYQNQNITGITDTLESGDLMANNNVLFVNITDRPELNNSAIVTFRNVTGSGTPQVLLNGFVCASCGTPSQSGSDYTFSITSWESGNYTINFVSVPVVESSSFLSCPNSDSGFCAFLNAVGAGLGLFIQYLGNSLPLILVALGILAFMGLIGYALGQVIRAMGRELNRKR